MKMNAWKTAIAALALLIAPATFADSSKAPMAKPESVGMSTERLERLSNVMQDYIDRDELAGTVTLIARRGKIVHFEAQGLAHIEAGKPMTKDTIFRIASMTKPITSVALMMLFEEGYFVLDDPISKWLPEFADMEVAIPAPADERVATPFKTVPAKRPITIRHVLTHTAGLPNNYRGLTRTEYLELAGEEPRPETAEESITRLAQLPLNFHPGDQWEYGPATTLCGVLVEKMSGMTLDQFFRERILLPLGMYDTFFNLPDDKVERVAARYAPTDDGGLREVYTPAPMEPTKYFSGGGGLWSTTYDYWRFHQMMLNGGELDGVRILGRKTIETMISNHIGDLNVWLRGPGYGFGLGYSILLDPGRASEPLSVGTFSWGGAYNTYFWVDPGEEMIGIFMSQLRPYTHLNVRTQLGILAGQAIIDSRADLTPTIMGNWPVRPE